MNIAELFVNLGIKGAEKTIGALGNVRKGMGELGSTSLETKAAIVGAMYGLERLMSISGAAGTGFTNFTALTGKSAQDLQRWQYAARQAGVGADELTGSMKSVQMSMANMLLGKGAPEGMALLSKAIGGINPQDYRDTFKMMQHLQEGLQKMSPEMAQMVGKSFGLSEGTIAAMRRNMFTPAMLAKAPTYSDKEIGSLNKSNIAWSNLGNQIQMAFGHFNARHGQQLVGDISKLVPQVLKLAEAFTKLAETLHVFEGIGKIFSGWTMIFQGLSGMVNDVAKDKKGVTHGIWDKLKGGAEGFSEAYKGMMMEAEEQQEAMEKKKLVAGKDHSALVPKMPQVSGNTTNHTTNVNQTITHHGDAKDTRAVKDLHKTSVNHAYRQRPAQRQGS